MYCTISYWTNILRTWHQTRRHTSKHSVNPFNKQLKITRTWCHQSLQHYGWLVRQNPQNSNPPPAHQMYHGHPPPVSKQILFCLESIADIPIVDLSADWDSGSSPQSESLFGSSTPPNSPGHRHPITSWSPRVVDRRMGSSRNHGFWRTIKRAMDAPRWSRPFVCLWWHLLTNF